MQLGEKSELKRRTSCTEYLSLCRAKRDIYLPHLIWSGKQKDYVPRDSETDAYLLRVPSIGCSRSRSRSYGKSEWVRCGMRQVLAWLFGFVFFVVFNENILNSIQLFSYSIIFTLKKINENILNNIQLLSYNIIFPLKKINENILKNIQLLSYNIFFFSFLMKLY